MSTSLVNGIGPPTRVDHRRHPPHLPAPLHRERAAEEPRERAVRQLRPPLLRPGLVQQQRVVELGERGDPAHQEPAPAEPPAEGPQPSGAVGSSCARRSGARPPPSGVPRHHLGAPAPAVASLARDEHVGATPVPRAVAPAPPPHEPPPVAAAAAPRGALRRSFACSPGPRRPTPASRSAAPPAVGRTPGPRQPAPHQRLCGVEHGAVAVAEPSPCAPECPHRGEGLQRRLDHARGGVVGQAPGEVHPPAVARRLVHACRT
jgi:hypothetical protein